MSGKAARGKCDPVAANDQWERRRVVFDLRDGAGALFVQPSVFTELYGGARPDGGGPQKAVVTLHSVAAVRDLGAPTAQLTNLGQPDMSPPIAFDSGPVGVSPVQRGGFPQYRVKFVNGDNQESLVYCDGNSVLALPARLVTVHIMTPPLLVPVTTAGIPESAGAILVSGMVVEADASAYVSWGLDSGDSAPMGECTYSQAVANTLNAPMFFERPPFAKRVTVITPPAIGALISFTTSPTLITSVPPGTANAIQQSQPVPFDATHVRVDLPVGTPAGSFTHCIWQIGT